MNDVIDKLLKAANGRRRTRTLDRQQFDAIVAQVGSKAGAFAAENAGQVSSSYQGRSETTVVLAVRRTDGRLAVAIGSNHGKQGSASRPFWLAQAIRTTKSAPQVMAWADAALPVTREDGGIVILGGAQ